MINILKNTFAHIPSVTKDFEKKIWQKDIYTWDEFLARHDKLDLKKRKKDLLLKNVEKSIDFHKKKDYSFFLSIPSNMHWRLYREMKNKCCFLDIETTGLSKHNDDLTLIGMNNGKKSSIFINGKNLDKFEKEFSKYDLIVTYNGKCFDIPFIRAKFPNISFEDKFHIDLRYDLRKIGYSGGLKNIERQVGIARDSSISEVDGFEAVRLWYKHLKGDKEALNTLVEYNKADIENLVTLMDFAFPKLKEKEFFEFV